MPIPPVSLVPTLIKTVASVKAIAAAPAAIGTSAIGSSLTLITAASLLGGVAAAGLGIYALIKARERAKARAGAINAISDYRPPSTQEIIPAGEPPFYGGQTLGARYIVRGTYLASNTRSSSCGQTRTFDSVYPVSGRILGLEINAEIGALAIAYDNGYGKQYAHPYSISGTNIGIRSSCQREGGTSVSYALSSGFKITEVIYAGGNPDTGGNPSSTPAVNSERSANTTFPYIPPDRFLNAKDYGLLFEPKKPVPIHTPERFTRATDYSLYKGDVVENPPIANSALAPKVDTAPTNKVNRIDNELPASNTATTTAATATAAKPNYPGQTINRRTVAGGGTRGIGVTGGTTTIKTPTPAAEGTETKGLPIEINPADGAKPAGTVAGNIAPTTPVQQTAIPTSIGETIGELSPGALAAISAVMFAPQNLEKIQATTEDAICNSTTGGCMKNNILKPIQDNILGIGNLFGQLGDLYLLKVINDKLGDQLPSGISGYMKTAWQSLRVNKILDYLNTILLLHNAAMLSKNLAASLGDSISAVANNTISLIKNEEGNPIDINETIGNSIEGFLKNLLGADNYNDINEVFQKSSRILNAATNIINTIQFSLAGLAEGLETLGNYTGKIGNSLKKAGVVFENSYQWMSEKFTVKTGRLGQIQAFMDGVEQLENIASDLQNVTSEFREVQENVTEIGEQFNNIKTEINTQEIAKTELETQTKTNSQGAQPDANDYTPDPIE